MMKKIVLVLVCLAAAGGVWYLSVIHTHDVDNAAPVSTIAHTISVGWVGDMVPSSDIGYNLTALNAVTDSLEQPDLMMGNLEGTFAQADRTSKCLSLTSMCHAFQGDSSFADTLKAAGFDFVSLVNNHSYDFGDKGLADTEAELDRVGLAYIAPNKQSTSLTIKGVKIGIVGLSSSPSGSATQGTINDYSYIANTVIQLKKDNDIVIVIFHGGAEGADKTKVPGTNEYMGSENRGNVQAVAYTAINAGADLVLGDGPHVLRKVEWYNNKPIAYSLGNFVGGKGRLSTPSSNAEQPTSPLSLGGIFTATFNAPSLSPASTEALSGERPHFAPTATGFTSVILSKDGIPSLDPTDQAKHLLDSLSGPIH